MNQIHGGTCGNSTSISWSGDASEASQIDMALAALSGSIEGLYEVIANAERRFDSVLLPEQPPSESSKAGLAPAPLESVLLSRINAAKRCVVDANARLTAIINRSQV